MSEFLTTSTFLGNDLRRWLVALAIGAGTMILVHLVLRLILPRLARLAGRTQTQWDDLVIGALGRTKGFFPFMLGLGAGAVALDLPARVSGAVATATVIAFLLQAGLWISTALGVWLVGYQQSQLETNRGAATTVAAIGFAAQVVIWAVILLLTLDNLGINVTALIAGLGVGGVAIALALQKILGDLFASLAIVLDRPFVLGDFLALDTYLGSVEHIGLKTTRLRSLSGEQVVISNADLLGSRIRNYGRMRERRIVFKIGVTYQTPKSVLKEIPSLLRAVVEARDKTRFDRAHFATFGDSSLIFETVYYVESPEYGVYMDIQQAINLDLVDRFEEREIEFAYPTQTLYLARVPAAAT